MANSRGRFFVDRTVQGALVTRIIVHWCVFFVLSVLCLVAIQYFTGEPGLTFGEHLGEVWGNYAFFLLLMLALVPSFVYDSLKLSNRFAGPFMRLNSSLHQLAEGNDVENLKFRDNDFWNEAATDFNRVSQRIRELESEAAARNKAVGSDEETVEVEETVAAV